MGRAWSGMGTGTGAELSGAQPQVKPHSRVISLLPGQTFRALETPLEAEERPVLSPVAPTCALQLATLRLFTRLPSPSGFCSPAPSHCQHTESNAFALSPFLPHSPHSLGEMFTPEGRDSVCSSVAQC